MPKSSEQPKRFHDKPASEITRRQAHAERVNKERFDFKTGAMFKKGGKRG